MIVALAVVVLVAVAGVVAVVELRAHRSSPTAGGSTSTPADHSSSGSVPTQVDQWYQQVSPDFSAIQADNTTIAQSASQQDFKAVKAGCSQLKHDVLKFESDPAAPDTLLRTDLAHAMDLYSTSATECLAGSYTAAAHDLTHGTSWISRANIRITDLR